MYAVDPLINHTKISQVITQSLKMCVDPEGVAWKFVGDSFRDTYLAEFKKTFLWEIPLTNDRVYELRSGRSPVLYKDWLNFLNSKKPTTGKPKYMDEDT